MDETVDELLARARGSLSDGDWAGARDAIEPALDRDDSGEALDVLSQALFSAGEYGRSIERAEQAYAAYRARGRDADAALCARFIGYLHGVVHGNGAAAGGWMGRAINLIEAAGDCPQRARIELTRAIMTVDPVAREQHLTTAVASAQRHGDTDLVFDAMSQRGLHLVAAGHVDTGMALLDEALAAVAGGDVTDLVSIGAMYCKMLHACELTCDVRRAEEWLAMADRFVARTNRLPISAICRTHYAGVLTFAGRWGDAEHELTQAVALYDRTYRALRPAALARLAGLRVRQGRLDEAAELLRDAEHDAYAAGPQVELDLARGEYDDAAERARRVVRAHETSELNAAMVFLLVRAELGRGDTEAADTASRRLCTTVDASPGGMLGALADHAAGLVCAAYGDPIATDRLDTARVAFARLELPLEEARTRFDRAVVLAATRPTAAIAEARAALSRFQGLSAARDADSATALLRRLGVRGHTTLRRAGILTKREHDILGLLAVGLSNKSIATRLCLSHRTVEHHVSNILAKLGLTTRAEVVAHLSRTAEPPSAQV